MCWGKSKNNNKKWRQLEVESTFHKRYGLKSREKSGIIGKSKTESKLILLKKERKEFDFFFLKKNVYGKHHNLGFGKNV